MTRNMTEGSPMRCILAFAIPMFLGMLFQQLYNMVDTLIVGRTLGLSALAGVGSTGSLNFFVLGFCNGLCSGFGIPVAQMFGAKREDALRKFVTNSVWLAAFFSVVITALAVLFCSGLLRLMRTPEEAFSYAYTYIVIIFAGIPFTFLYNLCASIIRALGDSRSPLYFLIISSVLNVVLDLVFILGCRWGVAGAAIATVVSQAVSGVLCLIYMRRSFPILKMRPGDWRAEWTSLRMLCGVGMPMGLQYSITAIGSIVAQSAVNSFGEIAVAGVTAATRTYTVLATPLEALGATMGTYVGQNVGARKLDRVRRGVNAAAVAGAVIAALMLLIALTLGKPMLRLFINASETEAIAHAMQNLIICSAAAVFHMGVLVYRFSIQGMGYSPLAMVSGLLEMVARFFVAFGLAHWFGFVGVCFSNPVAWALADVFLLPAYYICKKRLGQRMVEQALAIDVE